MSHVPDPERIRPRPNASLSLPPPAMALAASLSSAVSAQGLHFTLSTAIHVPIWRDYRECDLHVLYDLDSHVYADRYELAQRPGYVFSLWGTSDLEKPVSAPEINGSVLLLTVDIPEHAAARSENITVDVPLHARYAWPVSGPAPAYYPLALKRPIGFFACAHKSMSQRSRYSDGHATDTLRRRSCISRCSALVYIIARVALLVLRPDSRQHRSRCLDRCTASWQTRRLGMGRHRNGSRHDGHVLLPTGRFNTNSAQTVKQVFCENGLITAEKQVSTVRSATRVYRSADVDRETKCPDADVVVVAVCQYGRAVCWCSYGSSGGLRCSSTTCELPLSTPCPSPHHPESASPQSSCDDAPSLLYDLPPLSPHALLQREVEYFLDIVSRLCRTLDVFRADLARNHCPLLCRDGDLTLSVEHPSCLLVSTQVRLCCNEDERHAFAEVRDFRMPLKA